MKYPITSVVLALATLASASSALALPNPAPYTFSVDLNTAVLAAAGDGPFSLEFQLNPGSGESFGNSNTATISDFTFTGGSADDASSIVPYGTGGTYTGSLQGTVTLNDAGGFIIFTQGFDSSVSDIKFNVSLTQNSSGQTPDAFVVAIDNGSTYEIGTSDPGSQISLVTATIGDANNTYATPRPTTVATYVSTGSEYGIPTDNDAGVIAAVPEPSTYALMGLAGLGLLAWRRRFGFSA